MRSRRRRQGIILALGFVALAAAGQLLIDVKSSDRSGGSGGGAAALWRAAVLRVVDGDTILVRPLDAKGPPVGGSGSVRVRYIGVDTPESVKPDSPVECFGHEASQQNTHLVAGKTVTLVPDVEPTDRFGRSLAYVYVGQRLVNAELLRGGYARTLSIEPNTSRAAEFKRLERSAAAGGLGIWGRCR